MLLLTEENCQKAQAAANQLINYPGKITNSVATMRSTMEDPSINAWIIDTEIGRQTFDKVSNYNENLENLSKKLLELYDAVQRLINESERANAAN